MSARLPVVPTILVALAVAAMIALGVWQLHRRVEKHAFIAQVTANPARPPVGFPQAPDDALLLRRSAVLCRGPVAIERAGAGAAGFRVIATCGADAEGSGARVQLGTTRDPLARVAWPGGAVTGWLVHAPDSRPLIVSLFQHRPQPLMLVSDRPLAGLAANAVPDAGQVPDNHLAYAVQWFLFAGIAAIIYAIAVMRRGRVVAAAPQHG